MDDLQNAALISILTASLIGSPHCSGMCGGFTLLYSQHCKDHYLPHILYNTGRLTTYAVLGVTAAILGKTIDSTIPIGSFAALLMGILLVLSGLMQLIGLESIFSKMLNTKAPNLISKYAKRVFTLNSWIKPYLIGVVTTFLPCGWLYAFVALALASADVVRALSIMFVFWLGTLPVMVSVALLGQKLTGLASKAIPRVSAVLIILAGFFSIYSHYSHAGHDGHEQSHLHHDH